MVSQYVFSKNKHYLNTVIINDRFRLLAVDCTVSYMLYFMKNMKNIVYFITQSNESSYRIESLGSNYWYAVIVTPLETRRGCALWMEMKNQPLLLLLRSDEVLHGLAYFSFTSAPWVSFVLFSSTVHLPQAGVQEEIYRPLHRNTQYFRNALQSTKLTNF